MSWNVLGRPTLVTLGHFFRKAPNYIDSCFRRLHNCKVRPEYERSKKLYLFDITNGKITDNFSIKVCVQRECSTQLSKGWSVVTFEMVEGACHITMSERMRQPWRKSITSLIREVFVWQTWRVACCFQHEEREGQTGGICFHSAA